jgi:hypothetical protein
LPKLPENCFEPFGKGGWPPISTWIIQRNVIFNKLNRRDNDIKPTKYNPCIDNIERERNVCRPL